MNGDIFAAFRWLVDVQRDLNATVAAALHGVAGGGHMPAMLIVLGLALGAIHALTPGHGKTVVMSYFLGYHARLSEGFATAAKIATAHTLSALLLVVFFGGAVTLLGRPSGAAQNLQTASYALITLIGAYYLFRALFPAGCSSAVAHRHLLPYAVGVLPCPLTMLVVGSAMAQGAITAGLALAVVMGAGAAATIALFGIGSIALRRLMLRQFDPTNRAILNTLRLLEIASSAIILLIGSLSLLARL